MVQTSAPAAGQAAQDEAAQPLRLGAGIDQAAFYKGYQLRLLNRTGGQIVR